MTQRLKYHCRRVAHQHLDGQEIIRLEALNWTGHGDDRATHCALFADGTELHVFADEISRNPYCLTEKQRKTFSQAWRDQIDSMESRGYAVTWESFGHGSWHLLVRAEKIRISISWKRSHWRLVRIRPDAGVAIYETDEEAIEILNRWLEKAEECLSKAG